MPVFVYGVYALRVVSTDKILRFIYTYIITVFGEDVRHAVLHCMPSFSLTEQVY